MGQFNPRHGPLRQDYFYPRSAEKEATARPPEISARDREAHFQGLRLCPQPSAVAAVGAVPACASPPGPAAQSPGPPSSPAGVIVSVGTEARELSASLVVCGHSGAGTPWGTLCRRV